MEKLTDSSYKGLGTPTKRHNVLTGIMFFEGGLILLDINSTL